MDRGRGSLLILYRVEFLGFSVLGFRGFLGSWASQSFYGLFWASGLPIGLLWFRGFYVFPYDSRQISRRLLRDFHELLSGTRDSARFSGFFGDFRDFSWFSRFCRDFSEINVSSTWASSMIQVLLLILLCSLWDICVFSFSKQFLWDSRSSHKLLQSFMIYRVFEYFGESREVLWHLRKSVWFLIVFDGLHNFRELLQIWVRFSEDSSGLSWGFSWFSRDLARFLRFFKCCIWNTMTTRIISDVLLHDLAQISIWMAIVARITQLTHCDCRIVGQIMSCFKLEWLRARQLMSLKLSAKSAIWNLTANSNPMAESNSTT